MPCPSFISRRKEQKLPCLHLRNVTVSPVRFLQPHSLVTVHPSGGWLPLKIGRDNLPNAPAFISQPEDISLPLRTFLPSRLRPTWSHCSLSTPPCWGITPNLLSSLGLALSPPPSNTYIHHSGNILPRLRAILQLTGERGIFDVCWLCSSKLSGWPGKQLPRIT